MHAPIIQQNGINATKTNTHKEIEAQWVNRRIW